MGAKAEFLTSCDESLVLQVTIYDWRWGVLSFFLSFFVLMQ
jgi:hypothetical protein